ncbi:hypothetical protein LH991_03180 [Schleiferilactobacillus harbinensis]|jgi:hypothetical protein|uniref:Uncharacterized protein n=1 Tax=Schleiferilactobacillus harbinensis DSM 16991 TaxID=1122147 RepID=A0A0R1XB90_9LACO|nr:hypothetical protein [Schleiferilactobacillus harbinensis]KRM27362.1 hypothetical protein FC91_GL002571 [Schleiferilactobacillus harbinensis DSM 16991]MCT2909771.1 hypothetical protein [Schleiferilactobacillus harbinensis]QFR63052.1 hypothetical protein LH991_03180 [Schleiferilactobacillus harbinensis]
MKVLFKPVGGQSPVAWLLQIGLLAVVWAVFKKTMTHTTALLIAAVLIIVLFGSFALTKRFEEKE